MDIRRVIDYKRMADEWFRRYGGAVAENVALSTRLEIALERIAQLEMRIGTDAEPVAPSPEFKNETADIFASIRRERQEKNGDVPSIVGVAERESSNGRAD